MRGGEVRRSLELLAGAGVAAAATLAYVIWVGRTLGPAAYGEFSTALAIVYFFAIVLSPLSPAIARVAARVTASGRESTVASFRRMVQRRLVVASAVVLPLLLLGSIPVARALRFESAYPVALAFTAAIAFSVLGVDRGFLQGLFRFRSYNANILVEAGIRLGLAVALLQVFPSAVAALAAYVAALVAAETLAGAELEMRLPKGEPASPAVLKEVRRLLGPMSVLMFAAAVYQNLDMMTVKRWFDPIDAGMYGASLALAKMFGVVFTPLWVLIGPILSRDSVAGRPLRGTALRVAAVYVALCAVALLALFFRGGEIVAILFGGAFVPGAWLAFHLGLVSTMMHTSLLLCQVFVTTEEFGFLGYFVAAAAVQVLGLLFFHGSLVEILAVLYAAQAVLLLPILLKTALAARGA